MKRLLSIAFLNFMLFILSCDAQEKNDVTIIKKSANSLIDKNSEIEVLGDSFIVAEGPLWDSKNNAHYGILIIIS